MIASILISFSHWDVITAPDWAGLDNYKTLLFNEPLFWKSMRVTLVFTLILVPVQLSLSLLVAILLNQKVMGMPVFRTMFYLPTVLPVVASSMLWLWILYPQGFIELLYKSFRDTASGISDK